MSAITSRIQSLIKTKPERAKIVILHHYWIFWENPWTKPIVDIMNEHSDHVLLGHGEMYEWGDFNEDVKRFILPYKATSQLEKDVDLPFERNSLMYFAGTCKRTDRGHLRNFIMTKLLQEMSSFVQCQDAVIMPWHQKPMIHKIYHV